MDFFYVLREELARVGMLSDKFDDEECYELVPMQPGDVSVTYADTDPLERDFNYRPMTEIREGLRSFVKWFKDYE